MSKYSKKALASKVNSVRPYKSRTKRPCDFCRRRKTCCIIEESTPCMACASFNKGVCTFLEEPVKRTKKPGSPNSDKTVVSVSRRTSEPQPEVKPVVPPESPQSAPPPPADYVMSYPQATQSEPVYGPGFGTFDYYENMVQGHPFHQSLQLPQYPLLSSETGKYPDDIGAAAAAASACAASVGTSASASASAASASAATSASAAADGRFPDATTADGAAEMFANQLYRMPLEYESRLPTDTYSQTLYDSSSELDQSRLMSVASVSTFNTSRNPSIISPGSMPESAASAAAIPAGYFESKQAFLKASQSSFSQQIPQYQQLPQFPQFQYSQVSPTHINADGDYGSDCFGSYSTQGYEYA